MGDKEGRRKNVGVLNDLAVKHKVPQISRDAPLDAVRAFYRDLLLVCHPDKGKGGTDEEMHQLQAVKDYFKGFIDKRRATPVEGTVELPGVEGGGVLAAIHDLVGYV